MMGAGMGASPGKQRQVHPCHWAPPKTRAHTHARTHTRTPFPPARQGTRANQHQSRARRSRGCTRPAHPRCRHHHHRHHRQRRRRRHRQWCCCHHLLMSKGGGTNAQLAAVKTLERLHQASRPTRMPSFCILQYIPAQHGRGPSDMVAPVRTHPEWWGSSAGASRHQSGRRCAWWRCS